MVGATFAYGEIVGGLAAATAIGGALGYWWQVEGLRVMRELVHLRTTEGVRQTYVRRLTREGKPFLLSNGEQRFYLALKRAIGRDFDVHFKLRVADIIVPKKGQWSRGYGEAVAKQHVDFVICKAGTSYAYCLVELDDKSHDRPERRRRDEFLDAAYASAGVTVLRFPAKHPREPYDEVEIRRRVYATAKKERPSEVDAAAEFAADLQEEKTLRRG